jgi:DNA repair protein RecO (recombination protein O)
VVREDLDRLAKATSLLESVDQVTQERSSAPRVYQMLLGALRALAAQNSALLVPAFFWKLLSAEGVHPLLEQCARCGVTDPGELVAFELAEGGVLCRSCRSGVPISADALALLRRILGGGLASCLGEPASRATREVDHLATAAMETHLERRLRSISVLDRG